MKQWVNNISRYLRLYCCLVKLSTMSVIIYRASSLFLGITPVVWMGTTIVFISVIFKGIKEIAGWNYWEIMLLVGIHELVFLGTWVLFADNLEEFIRSVRQGTFDKTLLRPVNHRFFVSFNSVDFTAIGSLFNTIAVLSFALAHVVIRADILRFLLFLISLASAYLIVYLLYFLISSLSLFFISADTFTDWLMEMTEFDRYPAEIYGPFLRRFLFFGIPILFFAYVPAGILLNKVPEYYAGLGVLVVIWLYSLSTLVWRWGLRNYQSASS